MISLKPEQLSVLLNYVIGALQIIILITPFIAKGKLYDGRPANFLEGKTNIFQRTKPGLYLILVLSLITLFLSSLKQEIDSGIATAISKEGYVYDGSTKSLIITESQKTQSLILKSVNSRMKPDTVYREKLPNKEPLISLNYSELTIDTTFKNGIISLNVPFSNMGNAPANNITFISFVTDLTPTSEQKLRNAHKQASKIQGKVLPDYGSTQTFKTKNPIVIKKGDTIYTVFKVSYENADTHKKHTEITYHFFTIANGSVLKSVTDTAITKKLFKLSKIVF